MTKKIINKKENLITNLVTFKRWNGIKDKKFNMGVH